MCVNDGQWGEIIVSGPHVLTKYYNNNDAFKQNKIIVGDTVWHRTGDSGFVNNGELYLTGRCMQLILTGNGYLSPFVIENQLQDVDGISAGTLLQHNGQLVLVAESNRTALQLEKSLREIPHHQIKVVARIPRDPRHHSKIDYEKLKEMLSIDAPNNLNANKTGVSFFFFARVKNKMIVRKLTKSI
ncbi:MAG: AMP-binding protein [Bacteroidales bacterium]|nr:AMP-binding protein [Bacteroidales bacterium]